VLAKTLKKLKKNVFVFMHTAKYLKKNHIIFSYNQNSKKYVLTCILTLITSLLKPREIGQNFKKLQKIILFSFDNKEYALIRKA